MLDRRIYLDNAATTRMDEQVLEVMQPYFFDKYAVATSEFAYTQGIEAREALDEARGTLSKFCFITSPSGIGFQRIGAGLANRL